MTHRHEDKRASRVDCRATASIDIARPADEIWAVVREPTSVVRWNPIVEFARMEGSHRILELVTGDVVVERIDSRDDRSRTMKYSLVDGPIPNATHHGVIAVHPVNQRTSRVAYTVQTTPEGVPDMIAGTVELAVRQLAALMNVRGSAWRSGPAAVEYDRRGRRCPSD
jgi:hypothetical protein